MSHGRFRRVEIVAQDPSVKRGSKILTATVEVPYETLEPGPMGHAVHVVDYDASTGTFYEPAVMADGDVVAPGSARALLKDPEYHAHNVYALVMRTLARFEFALGRRVAWGTRGHQLKVIPHAFEEANAFYSPKAEALMFGYQRTSPPMFLCLSHDVVVHETAHALLDGLRDRFMAPSSADQAALHEAFADIIALLSVFSLHEVLAHLLDAHIPQSEAPDGLIARSSLTEDALSQGALLGLAEEMRDRRGVGRVNALRRSVMIKPNRGTLNRLEFRTEPHRRGEVVVAAFMRAFVSSWARRCDRLGSPGGAFIDRELAAEQGAIIADLLLTMAIRAIDYTPPIHVSFGDYVSALITADSEVRSDDRRYELREALRTSFASYGIEPTSSIDQAVPGCWLTPERGLDTSGVHFVGLQTDPTEMFRLVWNNREVLGLDRSAFTRIQSVRPCLRVSPDDGFQLRETVVELTQYLKITADSLGAYGLTKPANMADDFELSLEGGATLILDQFSELKFEITNPLPRSGMSDAQRQIAQDRLDYLFANGFLTGASLSSRLDRLHAMRARGGSDPDAVDTNEAWA